MIKSIIIAVAMIAAPAGADIVIINNTGGSLAAAEKWIDDLRNTGEKVIVRGTCASSCTMVAGLPNACTTRCARWGFHGTSTAIAGAIGRDIEAMGNIRLAESYPPAVADLFAGKWSKVKGQQVYWVSGKKMIQLGVKECQK